MTQPSAPRSPSVGLVPPRSGSIALTLPIGATALALGAWAALTWGAPALAEPLSEAWLTLAPEPASPGYEAPPQEEP